MAWENDSLRSKMALERERLPLLENPWDDEPPRGGRIAGSRPNVAKLVLKLAVMATAALVATSYFLTGMWPHQYARLTPAERVLVQHPLIGECGCLAFLVDHV